MAALNKLKRSSVQLRHAALEVCEMADFVRKGSVQLVKRSSVQFKQAAKEVKAAVRARHIVAGLVAVGFALCGAVEVSSSVALLANQEDNHAIIDTSWHCDMLVNISSRNRTEDFEVILLELPQEERAESIMREAFLWGQVAGPILGGCLVWGRSGPSMVFSRAVLGACLASILVPAAWRGPSHVALRLFQGLCTGATMPAAHMDSLCYGLVFIALCWYFTFGHFVKDTPKSYQHDTTGAVIPWGKLLRSVPVWASAVATMGNQWGDATLALGMTKYLKLIYGFSTANNSVLTTLPHIGHFMAALTCGLLVDHVRESGIVSTTTARKLVVYTAHFIPAALLFVAGYAGCQALGAAWLGIAALLIAGSWRLVFGVASLVLLITAAVFLALGKGVPQPWIPSVARPRSHDVIYEQDAFELDYEDVAVQTEPYNSYSLDEDIESNSKDIPRSTSIQSKLSIATSTK
ncbi:Similar to SLC17A5: Sialin (Homo sapiens) [Cotesia congregata]|uniref:Similar to SLC17A5: Sialin (Homo sapiens) n=1 Tax=Cotesia congregata TaxID=51543 RepID=A0A8J2E1F6_COTCN|nr:Similar to SLC17A5: Sialin (Homo sapiens) [Cotesia congregata]